MHEDARARIRRLYFNYDHEIFMIRSLAISRSIAIASSLKSPLHAKIASSEFSYRAAPVQILERVHVQYQYCTLFFI